LCEDDLGSFEDVHDKRDEVLLLRCISTCVYNPLFIFWITHWNISYCWISFKNQILHFSR